jgi:hypothetical protein
MMLAAGIGETKADVFERSLLIGKGVSGRDGTCGTVRAQEPDIETIKQGIGDFIDQSITGSTGGKRQTEPVRLALETKIKALRRRRHLGPTLCRKQQDFFQA